MTYGIVLCFCSGMILGRGLMNDDYLTVILSLPIAFVGFSIP